MSDDLQRTSLLRRVGMIGLVVGVVGGALCVFGYENARSSFYAAYLTAFMFWLNLTLGSMAVAMLHGLSGGGWGTTVRRVIEGGYQTLPVMALLFVPIWLDVAAIYEWADPEVMQHSEVLMRKIGYLNVDAWRLRAIVLFAIWFVSAALLHLFAPEGHSDDPRRTQRLQTVSGIGLFAYVFTVTVAAVDWVMSLEPHWFSTMYGVLYVAAQAVAGLALAIALVTRLARFEPWSRLVTPDRLNDLGNLQLAFVMFWTYVQLMQFLIIWSADLPEENVWYLRRSHGAWLPVAWLLIVFYFLAPFLMLLSKQRKRTPEALGRVALLLLAMGYLSTAWMTMPGFAHGDAHAGSSTSIDWSLAWLAPAAWLAIGGLWTAWFTWRLAARSRVPIYDRETKEVTDEHAARTVAG